MNHTLDPDNLKQQPWVCPECGYEDDDPVRGAMAFTHGICCCHDEPTVLTVDGLHVPPGGFKR